MERGTLHKKVRSNERVTLTKGDMEIEIKVKRDSDGHMKYIISAPKDVKIGVKNG